MPLDESPFLNVPGSRGGSQRGLAVAKNEVVKVNPFSFLEPNLRDSYSDSISQRQRSVSPQPFSSTKDAITNRLETAKTTLTTTNQPSDTNSKARSKSPAREPPKTDTKTRIKEKSPEKSPGTSKDSSQQEKAFETKTNHSPQPLAQPEKIPSKADYKTPSKSKPLENQPSQPSPTNVEGAVKKKENGFNAVSLSSESSTKLERKEVENEKVSPSGPSSKTEARKILHKKSNIMEKANQRASALNTTKISPKLVFATGASTLRSVRLEEMQVTLVILASTAEDLESSWTTPTLEGVASQVIVLDENRDNESQIEKYLHLAADGVHQERGVAMVHAPEGGAFKKGGSGLDSRRGEGFAAALCAAYLIKYEGQTTQQALESIK